MHIGSLFTALASYLDARAAHGKWLLRIDDLDAPREQKGATTQIIKTLEAFGLYWDGEISYQSQHQVAYIQAITSLQHQDALYPCYCSRKKLQAVAASTADRELVYPGFCRQLSTSQQGDFALRLKTTPISITFNDHLQGNICENMTEHGDFIIKRKDQIIAYQLAVVVDDHLQAVNQIVRGADLLDSSIKQIYLHQLLDMPIPQYSHVPLICGEQGSKLSKSEFAPAVKPENKRQILFKLLELLHQNPPADLKHCQVEAQLAWAIKAWKPEALKQIRRIAISKNELDAIA